jgi:hypothetical protein
VVGVPRRQETVLHTAARVIRHCAPVAVLTLPALGQLLQILTKQLTRLHTFVFVLGCLLYAEALLLLLLLLLLLRLLAQAPVSVAPPGHH